AGEIMDQILEELRYGGAAYEAHAALLAALVRELSELAQTLDQDLAECDEEMRQANDALRQRGDEPRASIAPTSIGGRAKEFYGRIRDRWNSSSQGTSLDTLNERWLEGSLPRGVIGAG